jgi:hypothetical protein
MGVTGEATAAMSGPAQHSPPARRADAGSIRLGDRDIAGLLLCGEMYGAPYDLLAAALGVQPARLRAIVARWRAAGYAATGRLGPGPAWCWLTRQGMALTGLGYPPSRPSLARLAHIRAVLAIRLALQDSPAYHDGHAWWRSERRIRAAAGWGHPAAHVPDAEVTWPDTSPAYPGQCWALEAELTPKPAGRTEAIMTGLLTHTGGYKPGVRPPGALSYDRVIYLAADPARPIVDRAAAGMPAHLAGRLVIRDLPPGAVL